MTGIRVLEMSSVISGPYTGMMLADLGAEVIKVEMPGSGDVFRQWAGDDAAVSPPFAAFNPAKKSVALDVREAVGAERYLDLASDVDVVFENFRPGKLESYGVGLSAVKARNPTVVYCAISGMGSSGPNRDDPTYDAIAQAMSGLWSQLTDMDDPLPVGPPMCDQLASLYAVQGILSGLLHRERTGEGQTVEISMLGAALSFQSVAIANHLETGAVSDMMDRAKRSQSYAFLCQDGKPIAIHLSTPDKFWEGLTDTVGRPDLYADDRFCTKPLRIRNYDLLRSVLSEEFARRSRAQWLEGLRGADVPCAPINTIEEALAEPQTVHLGIVQTFGDAGRQMRLAGSPLQFEGNPTLDRGPVPAVGEHTDEILGRVSLLTSSDTG